MFCDQTHIRIKAGNGGDGMVSFRREKFVPRGGPDGGDGGSGGSIILRSTSRINTLSDYRMDKLHQAEDGVRGGPKKLYGRSGNDLVLEIPVGTILLENNSQIFDFYRENLEKVVAIGGKGGGGNAHFTSSIRALPRFAEKGERMPIYEFDLELKLVADIGIIGFPSVGKSTLISRISNAKPKIAEYEFTTLVPNLGVVKKGDVDFVVADIPGLIEGASEGKGLGIQFLKHIERCGFLIHMIDGTSGDTMQKYQAINHELKKYSKELSTKDQIIVVNKIDSFDDEYRGLVEKECKKNGIDQVFFISAVSGEGLRDLLLEMTDRVKSRDRGRDRDRDGERERERERKREGDGERVLFQPHLDKIDEEWIYTMQNEKHCITGKRIEQIVNMTDTTNHEAVERLYDICEKKGIIKELLKHGWDAQKSFFVGSFEVSFR